MKSPLSLLLVAVAVISLGATAARADHDEGDRQYPERHHQHHFEGGDHGNRGDNDRDPRHDWRGDQSERARWDNDRDHQHDWRWR